MKLSPPQQCFKRSYSIGNGSLCQILNVSECLGTPASVCSLVPALWFSAVLSNSCSFFTFLPFRSFMFGLHWFYREMQPSFLHCGYCWPICKEYSNGASDFFPEVFLILSLLSLLCCCSEDKEPVMKTQIVERHLECFRGKSRPFTWHEKFGNCLPVVDIRELMIIL